MAVPGSCWNGVLGGTAGPEPEPSICGLGVVAAIVVVVQGTMSTKQGSPEGRRSLQGQNGRSQQFGLPVLPRRPEKAGKTRKVQGREAKGLDAKLTIDKIDANH